MKYHLGFSNVKGGACASEYVYWHDLGWTTAKTLNQGVANKLRKHKINLTAQEALNNEQIKVFEMVK